MLAGPAALAVALLLLPGWIYWRLEASPRTARSSLGEVFAVLGAGAAASGVTLLVYVSLQKQATDQPIVGRLVNPSNLTSHYARDEFTRVVWSAAAFVLLACLVAAVGASIQRRIRRWRSGDYTVYEPETPLWVKTLGNVDAPITVDLRSGSRVTGYFGGHSVDDQGAPTIFVTPPLALTTPVEPPRFGRPREPRVETFESNAITIPGSEVLLVWTEYGDDWPQPGS